MKKVVSEYSTIVMPEIFDKELTKDCICILCNMPAILTVGWPKYVSANTSLQEAVSAYIQLFNSQWAVKSHIWSTVYQLFSHCYQNECGGTPLLYVVIYNLDYKSQSDKMLNAVSASTLQHNCIDYTVIEIHKCSIC